MNQIKKIVTTSVTIGLMSGSLTGIAATEELVTHRQSEAKEQQSPMMDSQSKEVLPEETTHQETEPVVTSPTETIDTGDTTSGETTEVTEPDVSVTKESEADDKESDSKTEETASSDSETETKEETLARPKVKQEITVINLSNKKHKVDAAHPIKIGDKIQVKVTIHAQKVKAKKTANWQHVTTMLDYSDFSQAIQPLDIENMPNQPGTVLLAADKTLKNGQTKTFTQKFVAKEQIDQPKTLVAMAIGENGETSTKISFGTEQKIYQPIKIKYVYANNHSKSLPKTKEVTLVKTPADKNDMAIIEVDKSAKGYDYQGNSLNLPVNDKQELIVPFTDKEQTVSISYSGQLNLLSVPATIDFGSNHVLGQIEDKIKPVEVYGCVSIEDTRSDEEKNWQLTLTNETDFNFGESKESTLWYKEMQLSEKTPKTIETGKGSTEINSQTLVNDFSIRGLKDQPIKPGKYTSTLNWNLSEAPTDVVN